MSGITKEFNPIGIAAAATLSTYMMARAATSKQQRVAKMIASIPCCLALMSAKKGMGNSPLAIPFMAIGTYAATQTICATNNRVFTAIAGLAGPATLITGASIGADVADAAINLCTKPRHFSPKHHAGNVVDTFKQFPINVWLTIQSIFIAFSSLFTSKSAENALSKDKLHLIN